MTVEAVYWRNFTAYASEERTVEDAIALLKHGEAYGLMAGVGVFVDGKPTLTDVWLMGDGRPPTPEEAQEMREDYAQVRRRSSV